MFPDMIMPTIPPEVQRQLDQNAQNREIEINASKIQLGSTAEQVATSLYRAVLQYQKSLPDTEDVAMMLVQFNQSTTILVRQIGYIGYSLIYFLGEDTSGKPLELIQHVQQLNFLLKVVPKPEPESPKRQIGFVDRID